MVKPLCIVLFQFRFIVFLDFFILCILVFRRYVSMCTMCMPIGAMVGFKPPCGARNSNLGPFPELQALATTSRLSSLHFASF